MGDIEIELNPLSKITGVVDNGKDLKDNKGEREPTDDELLNWSAPYIEELDNRNSK